MRNRGLERLRENKPLTEHDITVCVAYCHEELLRLAKDGRRPEIDAILRSAAHAEIKLYRDVSLAVMARMGRGLGWSSARSAVLAAGIHGVYVYERLGGWRRMTSLRMPKVAMLWADWLSRPRCGTCVRRLCRMCRRGLLESGGSWEMRTRAQAEASRA